jgi:hypothetical protein
MVTTIQASRVVGRTFRVWITSLPQLLIVAAIVHVPRFGVRWFTRGVADASLLGQAAKALPFVEALVASAFVGSFAVRFVFQRLRGEPPDLGRSIAIGFTRIGTVLGIVVALGLPYVVIQFVPLPVVPAAGSLPSSAARQQVLALLGAELAKLAGIVLILLVNLMFQVAMPAAVVERRGVVAALARSRRLTAGNRLKILGALTLLTLTLLPLTIPTVVTTIRHATDLPSLLLRSAFELVAASIACVFPSVLYHALREAKEGTGLEELAAAFE